MLAYQRAAASDLLLVEGLEPGPSACEASALTTQLLELKK